MDTDTPAVTISGIKTYTEATHSVSGTLSVIVHVQVPGSDPVVARSLVAHYHWRGQLGHTWWQPGNIEISGRDLTSGASMTVIVGLDDAPEWARAFACRWQPRHLHLEGPGLGDPEPQVIDGPITHDSLPEIDGIVTRARHALYAEHVVGAQNLPTESGTMIVPQRLDLTWELKLGDQHVSWTPPSWYERDVEVTGTRVDEHGTATGSGRGRVSPRPRPAWLEQFVQRHYPYDHHLVVTLGPRPWAGA